MYALDFVNELNEKSAWKPIDARTHGLLDYAHVAFFFTMGLLWRKRNGAAAAAAFSTAGVLLGEALLTDYPLGAIPAMSFVTHRRIDVSVASCFWAIPFVFGFKDAPEAKVFAANSAVESVIASLTDWKSA